MRSKGIFMEVRERLPKSLQPSLTVKDGELTLRMPQDCADMFAKASAVIAKALDGIERRPVIPREIEDILGITTTERRRWLADGRLPSAGTRTLKLRGRGTITFHIFDPKMVQEILDQDMLHVWREEDAEKAAEKKAQALWKAGARRAKKPSAEGTVSAEDGDADERFQLRGWGEFERDGPR